MANRLSEWRESRRLPKLTFAELEEVYLNALLSLKGAEEAHKHLAAARNITASGTTRYHQVRKLADRVAADISRFDYEEQRYAGFLYRKLTEERGGDCRLPHLEA